MSDLELSFQREPEGIRVLLALQTEIAHVLISPNEFDRFLSRAAAVLVGDQVRSRTSFPAQPGMCDTHAWLAHELN